MLSWKLDILCSGTAAIRWPSVPRGPEERFKVWVKPLLVPIVRERRVAPSSYQLRADVDCGLSEHASRRRHASGSLSPSRDSERHAI